MAYFAEMAEKLEAERDNLLEDVKELESTVDGLSEAVTDLETEREATAEAMLGIARELDLLAEVPLQDLEESIEYLAARLRGLTEDPETLFAGKAADVRYYRVTFSDGESLIYKQTPEGLQVWSTWSTDGPEWAVSAMEYAHEWGPENNVQRITVDDLPAEAR